MQAAVRKKYRQTRQGGTLEVEVGVGVTSDFLISLGAHYLLYLLVDKVVEGVNVLPHQASDLREQPQLTVQAFT